MSETEQIEALFRQMGAEERQAKVMAAQLTKRADQMVEERGIDRVSAMGQLLELVKRGRSGEAYSPPESPAE